MRRTVIGAITASLCLGAVAHPGGAAGQTANPPGCGDQPGFDTLDFWVGEWEVVDESGALQGTNRIERVLARCAIVEHWTAAGGSRGMSLFYVEPGDAVWKQVWVTESATAPGGLKEKQLIERFDDGGVRFQGLMRAPGGRTWLDRTTLTPNPDGTVRQHIQQSMDDGQTWNAGWVGIYRPRS